MSIVAIILRADCLPKYIDKIDNHCFIDNGEEFTLINNKTDWFGFYDWLRNINKDIVGLRLQIDGNTIDINQLLALGGMIGDSASQVIFYFGSDTKYESLLSDDADFGGNKLYISKSGALAITFNMPNQG
jgi:hypothetical protein